jgi:hypothetical protein
MCCDFSIQILSETFLTVGGNKLDITTHVQDIGLHVKCRLALSGFDQTYIFSTDFPRNTEIWNLRKMCWFGAELFRADGQTDGRTEMTKLIVVFLTFANAPNKYAL